VERGVGTGARLGADAVTLTAGMSHRAITERILWQADRAGRGAAALIDADPRSNGAVTAWPRFAHIVRTAAAGLGRRGVADGDTVAVLVHDAASHAMAVHAIRAAGAAALAIGPPGAIGPSGAGEVEGLAAQLSGCGARVLITAAPLAGIATLAADRSWVRQVFAFGEAEGTTPFSSLLEAGAERAAGLAAGPEPAEPEPAGGLPVARGDVVVAAPPCGDGQAYTSLLDLALLAGATIVATPVPQVRAALHVYRGVAAIVPRGTPVPGLPADRVFAVG
jgi:hypothetical protein